MAARPDAILVDAHNIIYRQAVWRRLLHDDAERARAAFEASLSGHRGLWLFYDGGPDGRRQQLLRDGRQIIYAGGAGEADTEILRWLRGHQQQRALLASDDAALRRQARQLGARLLAAEAFLERYCRPGLATDEDPEADRAPPPDDDVDFWLREFSG